MLPTPSWLRFRKSRSQQQHQEQDHHHNQQQQQQQLQQQHQQQQQQHQKIQHQQRQKPNDNNNNKTKTSSSNNNNTQEGSLSPPPGDAGAPKARLPLVRRALASLLARATSAGRSASPVASGASAPLPASADQHFREPKSPLSKLKRRVKSKNANTNSDDARQQQQQQQQQPRVQEGEGAEEKAQCRDQGGAKETAKLGAPASKDEEPHLEQQQQQTRSAGCQQMATEVAPPPRRARRPQRQPEGSCNCGGGVGGDDGHSSRQPRIGHCQHQRREKAAAAANVEPSREQVDEAGKCNRRQEGELGARSAASSHPGGQNHRTIGPVCHLTSKTSDNQCALHGPVPITTASVSTMSAAAVGGGLAARPPEAQPLASGQRAAVPTMGGAAEIAQARPTESGHGGGGQASSAKRARGAHFRRPPVASWPIAKQTLNDDSSFGDCEDIQSPHLSGRLTFKDALEAPGAAPAGNNEEDEGSSMAQHSTYSHRRPFGQCFVRPTTGWLHNAAGAEKINLANSSGSLKAKLLAARGFRRRSYDDQEGDNDFNIIIQPSDLHDIEKRASYNNNSSNNGGGNYKSYSQLKQQQRERQQQQLSQPSASSVASTGCFATFSAQSSELLAGSAASGDGKFGEQEANQQASMKNETTATATTIIMTDLNLAKCLLDQDYNRTVQLFIRKSALNWNFNSFTFDALCCGRSLTELLLHLFDYYDLYKIFNLDIINVLKCFRLLEFGYHSTNPYHNSIHAADVTQAMHCFIQENKIRRHMTHLETLCSILAAVCHDLDHPGVNQSFLKATNNPLASLYNNNSVLENHHWRFALCIFKESNLFDHFSEEIFEELKQQLKHLILATDIARQNDYLKRFKDLTQSREFSMQNTEDRALVLQMALKCADLGNPCRPWLISRVWSNLICDEFYKMGKIERQLGLPLTPICQREKNSIAGIQTDFFRFIVLPLLELWHKFLDTPLSNLLMSNFDHNYKRWQRANRIVQQLRRRKSVACLEPIDYNNESSSNIDYNGDKAIKLTEGEEVRRKSSKNNEKFLSIADTATRLGLCSKHSYAAIKRASSDYIKSGNGKLELLRNYQLDRIIEKSPLSIRSNLNKSKQSEKNQIDDSTSNGSQVTVNNGLMKPMRSVKYYPLIISLTS